MSRGWKRYRHRATEIQAAVWDGTAEQLYELFTPEEIRRYGIRLINEGSFFTVVTEVCGVPIRPGDAIIKREHEVLGGKTEVYPNRPLIFGADYEEF